MLEHHASWYNLILRYVPESLQGYVNAQTLATYTVMLLLIVAIIAGTRRMQQVPRGWQNLWEWTYEVFHNFSISVMGPAGARYMPFLATCFIFTFCLNLFGLIPGMLSPTASINMTLALSLVVFVKIQYEGFRSHRLGYLKHFVGEKFDPAPLFYVMAPINVFIHVVGELAKPVSLSVRLFGNIFGEETVVAQLTLLAAQIQQAIYIPIPIQLVMVVFALFGAFIQALVFTMLTAVYMSLALGEEHEEGHDEKRQFEHSSLEDASGEQV